MRAFSKGGYRQTAKHFWMRSQMQACAEGLVWFLLKKNLRFFHNLNLRESHFSELWQFKYGQL